MSQKKSAFGSLVRKYTPRSVYIPASLIFIFITLISIAYFLSFKKPVSMEDFPNKIIFASMLLIFKSFTFSYTNLIEQIRNNKILLMVLNLILFGAQIISGFFAVVKLTESNNIKEPFFAILIAAILFFVQVLLNSDKKLLKLAVLTVIFYGLSFAAFDQMFFDVNSDFFEFLNDIVNEAKFWNLMATLTVPIEFVLLLASTRTFLNKIKE